VLSLRVRQPRDSDPVHVLEREASDGVEEERELARRSGEGGGQA